MAPIVTIPLRILIADNEKKSLQKISKLLEPGGHTIVGNVPNGIDLLTFSKTINPDNIDLYIVEPLIPPKENDGVTASKEAYRRWRKPSIFYTQTVDPALLNAWGQEEHIIGLVSKKSDLSTLPFFLGTARREKTKRIEHGIIFAAMSFVAQRSDTTMHEAYERIYNYAKNSQITSVKAAAEIVEIFDNLDKKMK